MVKRKRNITKFRKNKVIITPMSMVRRSGNSYPTPMRTPSRGRGLRRMSIDMVAPIAQAAFGPPGRAAVAAGRMIWRGYKAYKARSAKLNRKVRFGRKGQFGGLSTGRYAKRFRRPTKKKVRRLVGVSKCLKTGYVETKEVYGKVDDADCVYVGQSTFDVASLAKVISCAILRKLFKKAGINVTNPLGELNLYWNDNADGFYINFQVRDSDGVIFTLPSSAGYVTVDGDTLESVAQNSTLIARVGDRLRAVDSGNRGDFERISLYSSDRNGVSTNTRLAAELDLRNEIIDIMISATLTVQNRTKSDGGSTEITQIDNQPLSGYLYEFTGAVPQSKQYDMGVLNRMRPGGVFLEQSVDLSPALLFKEPPVPKTFSNCIKATRVALQPGDLQKTYISVSYRGYFNNIMQKMKATMKDNNSSVVQYAAGKCQLFALEERLNTGSANLITVTYEIDRKVGAMLTTSRAPVALSGYTSQIVNNITV